MLFYSSPVLLVICHHPERLHITTAAGKQAKLVNQGREGWTVPIWGFSCWLEELYPRWSAFACLAQAALFAVWLRSDLSQPCEASWGGVEGLCSRAVHLNWKAVNWNKSLWALSYKQPCGKLVKGMLFRCLGTKSKASACVSLSVLTCLIRQKYISVRSFKGSEQFRCFLSFVLLSLSPYQTAFPTQSLWKRDPLKPFSLGLHWLGDLACQEVCGLDMVWPSTAGTVR